MFNNLKIKNMKNRNDEYGVFLYDGNDEFINGRYFSQKAKAIRIAKQIICANNEYVEVWKKDKEGYYGNSGKPLFKSDI